LVNREIRTRTTTGPQGCLVGIVVDKATLANSAELPRWEMDTPTNSKDNSHKVDSATTTSLQMIWQQCTRTLQVQPSKRSLKKNMLLSSRKST
jgi:hypothetical protein